MNIYLWPLLFVTMLIVLIIVVVGVINISSSKKNSGKKSNKLMIFRITAQAISLIIVFIIWCIYKK
jgi:cell division protein FtsW (lipid II flippase)